MNRDWSAGLRPGAWWTKARRTRLAGGRRSDSQNENRCGLWPRGNAWNSHFPQRGRPRLRVPRTVSVQGIRGSEGAAAFKTCHSVGFHPS